MAKKSESGRIVQWNDLNMAETVLGLDCSSTTVGWGLICPKGPLLLAHGHFKPLDSKHSEIERLNHVFNKTVDLCEQLHPKYVLVEDIFLFMKGKSRASTITILTAFNRVISLAAYKTIGTIEFYSVHQIRNIIKTCYKLSATIQKEEIPSIIRSYLEPKFEDLINKKNNIATQTFDEADGIAASWAKALQLENPDVVNKLLEKPKKKKKGKK